MPRDKYERMAEVLSKKLTDNEFTKLYALMDGDTSYHLDKEIAKIINERHLRMLAKHRIVDKKEV